MALPAEIQESFHHWWSDNRQDFDLILFDIDGTLVRENHVLPGVADFLAELESQSVPWYALTNDSRHSHREKSARIAEAGLDVPATHVVSCSDAIRDFVRDEKLDGRLFFQAGYLGQPSYGELAGLEMTEDPDRIPECRGFILTDYIDKQSIPDLILNACLRDSSLYVIVPNPDSYWPGRREGELVLGSAPVVKMLQKVLAEKGITMKPYFLGKPHHGIFDYALRSAEAHYGLQLGDRRRVLMIGDSVHSDIKGGNRSGLTTALVLTGVTHEDQLPDLHGDFRPKMVFRRMG